MTNLDQSIHIVYRGNALESRTRYYYRVRIWDNKGNTSGWSSTVFWETGLLKTDEWIANWTTPDIEADLLKEGCPLLRNSFMINGEVKAARIYATALGLYELHLNGLRISDYLFTPGWTSYNKRLQYQTYDVTVLLKDGANVLGAVLGNGWYKGNIAGNQNIFGDRLAVLIQLHITYKDGKEDVIISDANWKASTGPILMSEIYL